MTKLKMNRIRGNFNLMSSLPNFQSPAIIALLYKKRESMEGKERLSWEEKNSILRRRK